MGRDYQQLWKSVTNPTDKARAVKSLAAILSEEEGKRFISQLDKNDANLCIDILNHGIAKHDLKPRDKNRFRNAVRRLAEHNSLLPRHVVPTEEIEVSGEVHASGGFGDVRTGKYRGCTVAVKTAKVLKPQAKLEKIRKQFYKEIVLWSTLFHPNVLKLVGVQENREKREFITIAEWMEHGTIMEYIETNHANRLELLYGAAQGLEYLHSASLAHGDLKGGNILMSNDDPPRACLADFGFITGVLEPGEISSCSAQAMGGTMQFMAPELLVPPLGKKAIPTSQADIYAFSLVIFQVLTATAPFPHIADTAMGFHVVNGVRPEKPGDAPDIGFCDVLWGFAERCWNNRPELRPKVGEVVALLKGVATEWNRLMPPCAKNKCATSNPVEVSTDSGGPNPYPDTMSTGMGSDFTDSIGFSYSSASTQFTEGPEEEYQGKPDVHLERELDDDATITLRQPSVGITLES